MRSGIPLRPYLILALVLGAADLVSKWWMFASIGRGRSREVIPGFFVLRPHDNPQGPWSWGFGVSAETLSWALPILGVVAVGVLLRLMTECGPGERVKCTGFALLLGGAVGNLWDRGLTAFGVDGYHGVRDFLLFPNIVFGSPFPAFNLADTWITVGVTLVGLRILFERPGDGLAPSEAGAAPAPADAEGPEGARG